MSDTTGTDPRWLGRRDTRDDGRVPFALTIAWSLSEPWRVGQVAFLDERRSSWLLGRGAGEESERVVFHTQRPGSLTAAEPLGGRGLSRRQLSIVVHADHLEVERLGRAAMTINGAATTKGNLRADDVLALEGEIVLLCSARSRSALSTRGKPPSFSFGAPDGFGIVGESPRAWLLRDEIAFVARRAHHVLIHGPSGAGKELAARAIHGRSERGRGPFVSRNAATLPPGIIDAELFGNVKNYPNAGMPEREGLVGAADGGTLFLDELTELPESLQAHLLRLLDSGEYQRLGDSRVRRADLRVLGATNRPLDALKHDLCARFGLRLEMPGLDQTKEDIPLIFRHLLLTAAERDQELSSRYVESTPEGPEPRVAPELVVGLLRHRFSHHVRELESLMLASMSKSRGTHLELTGDVATRLKTPAAEEQNRAPEELTPEAIRAALELHDRSVTRAARELGLKNRDVLYRLMKKYGIKQAEDG